jgi:hypothetical protein
MQKKVIGNPEGYDSPLGKRKIILNIPQNIGLRMSIGFIWPKIRFSCGILWGHGNEPSDSVSGEGFVHY